MNAPRAILLTSRSRFSYRLARAAVRGLAVLAASACGGRSSLAFDDAPAQGALPDAAPSSDAGTGSDVPIYVLVDFLSDCVQRLEALAPATGNLTTLGTIDCAADFQPGACYNEIGLALAVDSMGQMYVANGNADQVNALDATTLACAPGLLSDRMTGYVPSGIAFVRKGQEDILYGAFDDYTPQSGTEYFGIINLETGVVDETTAKTPIHIGRQLAGTGDGRLFTLDGCEIRQMEPADVDASWELPASTGCPLIDAPIAWWNGDFYVAGGSAFEKIIRFRPSDGTVSVVADLGGEVGGAILGLAAAPCTGP
jgi:hypothetical protein